MPRPTAPVAGDIKGGRGFASAALAFTSNQTVTTSYFFATQGQTQMTFWVMRPTQTGTWLPGWIDDLGTFQPLLSAGRAIAINAVDGVTVNVNGDLFAIQYTNTNSTAGTVGNFWFGEAAVAG